MVWSSRERRHATSVRLYAPMDYRRLGSTGLRVSRLGLGCGNFGGIGSAPAFYGMGETEAQAFALMDRALDAGINFFDTAERLRRRPQRDVHRPLAEGEGLARPRAAAPQLEGVQSGRAGPNDRGLSRRHILRQVDESLAPAADRSPRHVPDPRARSRDAARGDAARARRSSCARARCSTSAPATSRRGGWRAALWISDKARPARASTGCRTRYSLLDRSAGARDVSALRRPARRLHRVQPARRRLADRQVPTRPAPTPKASRMTLRPEPYRPSRARGCVSRLGRP